MPFEDQDIPVARDAEKVTVLYLRDLPYEVASNDVIDFLSAYGGVLTVECSVAAVFTNLCDGTELSRWSLMKTCRTFFLYAVVNFVCSIVVSQSSALCAVNLVIGLSLAHCLAGAGTVINPAIWPDSVRRPGSKFLLQFLPVSIQSLLMSMSRIPLQLLK